MSINNWFKSPFLWLWLLANLFASPALAQEYLVSVQHYSVPEGLSQRPVRNITQDNRGFIWAATQDGINRFDGFDFQQYTKKKDGLSGVDCKQILEDRWGQLWLLYVKPFAIEGKSESYYPLDVFDPATGTAMTFEEKFHIPLPSTEIQNIKRDSLGNIYILLRSGETYRFDGFTLRRLPLISSVGACHLAFAGEGLSGLLCRDSLFQIDSLGKVLYRTRLPEACDFIRTANGRFWVGKNNPEGGPAMWSIRAGEPAQPFYFLDGDDRPSSSDWEINYETPIYPDRLGRWWVYSDRRLSLFAHNGQLLYDFSADLQPYTFSLPSVIYFDRHNTAWIGTSNGLLSVTIQKNPFDNYLQPEELADTRGIVEDEQGRVYVVQNGNTWLLDPGSETAINLGIPARTAAVRDAKGALWFGDYGFKVHFYDPVSREKKIFVPTDLKEKIQFNATHALFPDATSGRIWVGTNGRGLAYIDSLDQGITLFTKYNQFGHLQKANIKSFLEDSGGLWLGTNQGLYLFEPEKGITAEYSRRTGSLPFDDIKHVHIDKEGIFWLATNQGGLIRWDKETGNFRQFTQRDGLSNDVIHAVYEDESGQLWLPSNYALMRFDKQSFQVHTYLPRDGIPHEEFNYCSHYQAVDGRLFFGGLKGVTVFYPHELYQENQEDSPIPGVSQYLEMDGTTGAFVDKTRNLLAKGRIELVSQNKSFLLKIAFPDYQSPKDNRFAYRIEGLDETWIYQTDNTIRVNGLPYGSFTLQVKAQGANGRWSARELNLPLTMLRPFYLRWWFFIACIALVFLIISWRIQILRQTARKLETEVQKRTFQIEMDKKVIEKQAAELREMDELKSRFFTNVAHELRTPLTLIQGPLQIVLKKYGLDKDAAAMLQLAHNNTKNLHRLVEELLDLKKLDAGKLTLEEETVDFYPLVRRLVSNFESLAQANGIQLQLRYPEEQELHLILDTIKFERIILNLVSNALKFTPGGGLVQVQVADLGSRICVAINDSGRGIPGDELPYVFDRFFQGSDPSQSSSRPEGREKAVAVGGAGIGLALSQEYAGLMNGTLNVKSQPGEGSTFILEFPKKEVSEGVQPIPIRGPDRISGLNEPQSTNEPILSDPLNGADNESTILIVEDNLDMSRYLQEILQSDYKTLTAANGRIALDLLNKVSNDVEVPALIITDIMMPEMDGFALIRHLKSCPEWQRTPIIALTARTSLDDRISALRFGVDDYLAKPFEPAELLVRVANLLKNYRERREWLAAKANAVEENAYFLKIDPLEEIISADQQWLADLEDIALQKIGSSDFSVTELAYQLHLSERNLRRKLKELTGLSPGDYLKEIRLQRAHQLLEGRVYETVTEVSYAIGLSTPKHFSRLFKARFGKVPSSYF